MNSAMPWIKVYTEFVDDAKFASCTDGVKLRFIQLMLIAGECDADGDLVAGGEWLKLDQIAWRLRVMCDQLDSDIQTLVALGVIAKKKQGLTVVNFDKRQGRSQAVKRDQWRERQQRHRAVTRDSRVTHAGVTLTDKDKERDKDKDKEAASTSFIINSRGASRHDADDETKQADTKRRESLDLFGIREPELSRLVTQLRSVSEADFWAARERLSNEVIDADNAGKIKNWAGYAVSVFRELAWVTR
jgi:hypothetical protein